MKQLVLKIQSFSTFLLLLLLLLLLTNFQLVNGLLESRPTLRRPPAPPQESKEQERDRSLLLDNFFGSIFGDDDDIEGAVNNLTDEIFGELGQAANNLTGDILDETLGKNATDDDNYNNDNDDNDDDDDDSIFESMMGLGADFLQNIRSNATDDDNYDGDNDDDDSIIESMMGLGADFLQNITQELLGIMDLKVLFTNLTIPEEYTGTINVDLLFQTLFGPILAYFGIPGFEEYAQPEWSHDGSGDANAMNDGSLGLQSPYFNEPVPFGSECQLCDGTFDRTRQYGGLACEEWEIFAGFSRGEECSILRALAVESCGCKNNNNSDNEEEELPYCSFCGTDSSSSNNNNRDAGDDRGLPTMSGQLLCSTLGRLPAVDGDSTCHDIDQFSDFCGCDPVVVGNASSPSSSSSSSATTAVAGPSTTTTTSQPAQPQAPLVYQCTLCPDGGIPSTPDKLVFHQGSLTRNLTCAQVDEKLTARASDDDSCQEMHQQILSQLGTDVRVFCGCPSSATVSPEAAAPAAAPACEPCPPGTVLKSDNSTDNDNHDEATQTAKSTSSDINSSSSSSSVSPPSLETCQAWGKQMGTLLPDDPLCPAFQGQAMTGCCITDPAALIPETTTANETTSPEYQQEGDEQQEGATLITSSSISASSSSAAARISPGGSFTGSQPHHIILVSAAILSFTFWVC